MGDYSWQSVEFECLYFEKGEAEYLKNPTPLAEIRFRINLNSLSQIKKSVKNNSNSSLEQASSVPYLAVAVNKKLDCTGNGFNYDEKIKCYEVDTKIEYILTECKYVGKFSFDPNWNDFECFYNGAISKKYRISLKSPESLATSSTSSINKNTLGDLWQKQNSQNNLPSTLQKNNQQLATNLGSLVAYLITFLGFVGIIVGLILMFLKVKFGKIVLIICGIGFVLGLFASFALAIITSAVLL